MAEDSNRGRKGLRIESQSLRCSVCSVGSTCYTFPLHTIYVAAGLDAHTLLQALSYLHSNVCPTTDHLKCIIVLFIYLTKSFKLF